MVITKDSDTQLTVELTGAATSHDPSDDISNLGIAFNNTAFNNGNASAVTNASRSDISVLFFTPDSGAGNCLVFDGNDEYIAFGADSPPYSDTLSIEAWIKTTSTGTDTNNIVSWGNSSPSNGSNVQFRTNTTGKLQFGSHPADGGWVAVESSRAVNTGEWVHVAVTKAGSTVKLYINGVEDNGGINSNSMTVDRMAIAKYYEGAAGEVFAGSIDEVRLWNDARTEAEIRQNMYRQFDNPLAEANLVSYYKFNQADGETTAIDYKGDRDGALTNMTGNEWETSPAMFGPKNCLEFDGTNDYVRVDSAPAFSSTITIEAWIKTTSSADNREIVGWGHTSGDNVAEFRAGGGKLQFGMWDGAWSQIESTRNINSGNWTHVAVVKESASIKLYVDGEADTTGSISKSLTLDVMAIANLIQAGVVNAYNFPGCIDEVRIWSDARTQTELRENMYKNLTGNEGNLVAYYTFDDSSGSTLADFSGNAQDGTLQSMDTGDWIASTAFNTWLYTGSSSWPTAGNWSRESVPGSSDNVGIYSYTGGTNVAVSGSPTVNKPGPGEFIFHDPVLRPDRERQPDPGKRSGPERPDHHPGG